uniref:COP1-interactive protein 1-like n=1 Tax=Erigeron canadensis TaxID=72917 RepID=UPI001CB8F49E|nr:COP1-interactive protein 1-like [Erigeron canadensis]
MYSLYEDLREGVPRKRNNEEDKEDNASCTSTSSSPRSLSMESAGYYSPGSGSKTPSLDQVPKVPTTDVLSMKSERSSYSLDASSVESSSKEEDDRRRAVEKLMKETDDIRDRLGDSGTKLPNHGNSPNRSPSKMKALEDRLDNLKLEIDALNNHKSENEQGRHGSFHKRIKENLGLQSLDFTFREKGDDVIKNIAECEKALKVKLDDSIHQVQNLQMEVDSIRYQNDETRKRISYEKEKEVESLRVQNQESTLELKKKTKEAADSLEMLHSLEEKLKEKTKSEEDLKSKVHDLEVEIANMNHQCCLSKEENENQRNTISQLEENLQERDGRISTLESKIENVKRELTNKMKALEHKFKSLEIDKVELEGKNDVLAAALEQRDLLVSKLNHEAKSSFRSTVKKMGDMVDEFRKKSEDSIRILSRRIRVAEQLHNETREWYKKTREKNEQDRRDNELAFRSIKIITAMVSDTLSASETIGLRFIECCEDFTNRVSKVSCETNFVKDWVKRKNGVITQVKKDFDAVVVQLDGKEEEILGSRQKVLKLDAKLRDLEKLVKENDETIIGLKEEKREAIRQLCVWIDFHRGRADYFKKAFSELVAKNQRLA